MRVAASLSAPSSSRYAERAPNRRVSHPYRGVGRQVSVRLLAAHQRHQHRHGLRQHRGCAGYGLVALARNPQSPRHPSGHSTTGGGGARVLASLFGSDAVSFAVGSDTLAGVTRGFENFSDVEQENANSRIYGGIHYRFSNETGITLGHQIADYVVANYLKSLPAPVGEGGAGGEGPGGAGSAGGAGKANAAAGASGAGLGVAGDDTRGGGLRGAGDTLAHGGGTGGSGGKPAAPPPLGHDDDTSCAIARPGRSSSVFALSLLFGAAGLAWRRRRQAR